ncbi:MAG: preprotein translocase SecE subunit [Oceanicoccus sp.]|jgi:preprotein translocase SecE subunit
MTSKSSAKSANIVSRYLKDALEEYGKITWPTKEQAVLLTAVTIVVSSVVVLIIGLLDLGFTELYQLALDNL